MSVSLHETCPQYVARRLSEGWKITRQEGFLVILESPEGIIRPVDLRNDTETLRPNAAGDECSLNYETGASCPDHYQNVDEETADDATTKVANKNVASYQRDLYNLPASSGSGTINFIKIYFRCRKVTNNVVACYGKPSLKSNGTVTDGTEISLVESTWTTHSEQWSTNPADGEAWEWSDIDALQIGVSLKADTGGTYRYAECTQVYVEVDYTEVTPKTSSDAGSGADAYVSLEKTEAKSSSDTGSGAEGMPMQSAILASSETGSGIEALVARLLATLDTGTGAEVGGLLKDLFVSELGRGSDSVIAKIETSTKGGGMKLWT